jgi:hypothetical protein
VALRVRIAGETPLYREIVANRQQWRDEVQAACHRAGGDIWLEKLELRLETQGRTADASPGIALDLDRLLREHCDPRAVEDETEKLIADIAARLPAGLGAAKLPLEEGTAALIEEARQLLLARGERLG